MQSNFGYREDSYQQNKGRAPSLASPYHSLAKAQLSWPDLEALRIKGPFLLRRANELSNQAHFKPEVYVLDLDETGDNQASRIKIRKDSNGKPMYEFFRINSAPAPGCKVEVPTSRVSQTPTLHPPQSLFITVFHKRSRAEEGD